MERDWLIFCALTTPYFTHNAIYPNLKLLFSQVVKSASPIFLLITLFGAVLMYTEVSVAVFSLSTCSYTIICALNT